MIITAPYRSGGTIFASTLANETGKRFLGQIDMHSVDFLAQVDKNKMHEIKNQPVLTLNEINDAMINDENVVILNNSNTGLFDKTSQFLIRRNIRNVYYSHSRLLIDMNLPNEVSGSMKRLSYFIGLQLLYMQSKNITPLYYEDLYQRVTEYNMSDDINAMVEKHISYLKSLKTSFKLD